MHRNANSLYYIVTFYKRILTYLTRKKKHSIWIRITKYVKNHYKMKTIMYYDIKSSNVSELFDKMLTIINID